MNKITNWMNFDHRNLSWSGKRGDTRIINERNSNGDAGEGWAICGDLRAIQKKLRSDSEAIRRFGSDLAAGGPGKSTRLGITGSLPREEAKRLAELVTKRERQAKSAKSANTKLFRWFQN